MSIPRPHVRPRFEFASTLDVDEFADRARAKLASEKSVRGLILESRIELVPSDERQHFWSPQLTADIAPSEGGTVVHGRFGPQPSVWTLYVAIHATGAMATLGAAIFGLSQFLSNQSPWALWVLPAAPVLAALVWLLAFLGQSLGAEQMLELRRFIEIGGASPGEASDSSDEVR